mgnify:FL=1
MEKEVFKNTSKKSFILRIKILLIVLLAPLIFHGENNLNTIQKKQTSTLSQSNQKIGVEKRKEIWKAIILIENTAMRDAELKFQNASDWKAKMNYEDEQYQKYLKKLLKHYKIDEDIKGIIMMEAIENEWPEKGVKISLKI